MKDIEEIKPNLFIQKLKKDKYRMVKPIKKDLGKPLTWNNIHWKNFLVGDTTTFIISAVIMILLITLTIDHYNVIEECNEKIRDSCNICFAQSQPVFGEQKNLKDNIKIKEGDNIGGDLLLFPEGIN